MKVDELNRAAQEAYTASARQKAVKAVKQKPQKGVRFEFKPTDSGSGYYLYYQNSNSVFTKEEMAAMAKIAYCGESDLEIRERLYRWLYHERRDIFQLVPIQNKFDDNLKALIILIKKSFKLRK
jgi:nuclear transport factor 2 (NTF2) superfamily protein